MSGPGPDAAGSGQSRAPAGLLEKLMAAVHPEFRAGVLVFDPADPVFGGDACLVPQCGRTARAIGMCNGHHQRWMHAGRPDLGAFAVSEAAAGPWFGHAPLARCGAPGCGFGSAIRQMCSRHLRAWERAGEPERVRWLAAVPPVAPHPGQVACRISYCELWAHPGAVMCYSHHRRWKGLGRPDLEEFIAGYDRPPDGRERADLTGLPDRLRLEVQYALQCRHDDNMIKTRPTTIRSVTRWLRRQRLHLAARPRRAGLAGRLPAPCRPEPAPGRAADLRAPQGHRPRRGRGLGQRVPPRHLAPAPPRHRLPVRDPAVRRHHSAMAQGPGQTVDPMAAEHRLGSPDLLPRRPGTHPARRGPRRVRRHRTQRDQPGRPRALPRWPGRHDGGKERAPRLHRAGRHVPPRHPPPPVGHGACPPPR